MEKISYNILKENLENTYLFPKYPNGDLFESNEQLPFVDSSITEEQFKKEAERFDSLNSFWDVLNYSDLDSLKEKQNIFVMHPFKEEIINLDQLAIPFETFAFLNHKGNVNYLNSTGDKLKLSCGKTSNGDLFSYCGGGGVFDLFGESMVVKVPYSAAGDGVKIIKNYDDVDCVKKEINLLGELSKKRNNLEYLFQEYKCGVDLSLQGFISKSGEVFYVGHGIQNIVSDSEYDGLEVLLNAPKDKYLSVLDNVGKFANSKGFFGFFGLDLKETSDDKLYIIDPNFRPTDGTPKYLKALGII